MEEKEFERYIHLHADSLLRYLAGNLRDEEAAKDLVQESFIALWQNGEKVEKDKVKSWLFTTAHNRMLKLIRHNKVVREAQTELPTAKTDYENAQLTDRLLSHLGEKQRRCLMLKKWEGFSIKEIAAIMRMSEENVKVCIFRAGVKLRELKDRI